jgi:hypothetical protein
MARLGGIGLGEAEALIVHTTKRADGQLRGPEGLGDGSDVGNVVKDTINTLTGGAVSDLELQLADMKTYLTISIAASVISGVLAIAGFFRERSH